MRRHTNSFRLCSEN